MRRIILLSLILLLSSKLIAQDTITATLFWDRPDVDSYVTAYYLRTDDQLPITVGNLGSMCSTGTCKYIFSYPVGAHILGLKAYNPWGESDEVIINLDDTSSGSLPKLIRGLKILFP
jgi:hypothetical protein